MQLNQDSALQKLVSMGIDDMPVMEYVPKSCKLDSDWFQKYSRLRSEFLLSLSDSIEEIVFMNLPQDEFTNLIMGKSLPDNLLSVYLRSLYLSSFKNISLTEI